MEGRSIEDLPHFHNESILEPEEEGVLDSDGTTGGLQLSPLTLVRAVKRRPHGGEIVVCSDRVDLEPEVWEGRVPGADDAFERICVGDAGATPDVQRKLLGKQSSHPGEVPPVPAFLEHNGGDLGLVHTFKLANDAGSAKRPGAAQVPGRFGDVLGYGLPASCHFCAHSSHAAPRSSVDTRL